MEAVIFDMDGVLADSEPVICAAAIAMFKERGVTAQPADFVPFIGTGEDRYIGGPAAKYGLKLDLERAKARTYEIYLELVPTMLKVMPGAVALVRACRLAGLWVAVASSADRIKVEATLSHINLPSASFGAVITAENVVNKKPAPDLFLAAAREVGVPPAACCVIEDAVTGVQAAKAAGMKCIALTTTFPAEKLTGADLIRPNLAALKVADINALG